MQLTLNISIYFNQNALLNIYLQSEYKYQIFVTRSTLFLARNHQQISFHRTAP